MLSTDIIEFTRHLLHPIATQRLSKLCLHIGAPATRKCVQQALARFLHNKTTVPPFRELKTSGSIFKVRIVVKFIISQPGRGGGEASLKPHRGCVNSHKEFTKPHTDKECQCLEMRACLRWKRLRDGTPR